MSEKQLDLGSWVNDVVQHLLDNYSDGFDSIGAVVNGFSEGIEWLLMLPPAWLLIAIFIGLGLWRIGYKFAIFTAISFVLIVLTGFWEQTVVTLGLTFSSTLISLLLGAVYIDATSLAAWSALYFAINYFLQLEEQNDRVLRLEAQAASAQLAMLRYQLNPHFLFNTLNSISTLVLLKQTEPANAMLTRLSSFLRYSLSNEPTGRVTVAQEVETLKLYLDIERMRFEERLRTHFATANDAVILLKTLSKGQHLAVLPGRAAEQFDAIQVARRLDHGRELDDFWAGAKNNHEFHRTRPSRSMHRDWPLYRTCSGQGEAACGRTTRKPSGVA